MKKILIVFVLMGIAVVALWLKLLLFPGDTEVQDELPPTIEVPQEDTSVEEPDSELEEATTTVREASEEAEAPQTIFPIVGTDAHPASGSIRLVESPEEVIVRYENYDGTAGPDLYVYLASDLDATEFISLGPARGNKGNINYGVPIDIDLEDYPYVLTWCKAFGVLFDYAKIN